MDSHPCVCMIDEQEEDIEGNYDILFKLAQDFDYPFTTHRLLMHKGWLVATWGYNKLKLQTFKFYVVLAKVWREHPTKIQENAQERHDMNGKRSFLSLLVGQVHYRKLSLEMIAAYGKLQKLAENYCFRADLGLFLASKLRVDNSQLREMLHRTFESQLLALI